MTEPEKNVCQLCDAVFETRSILYHHFRKMHTDSLFFCPFPDCNQQSKVHLWLLNHIINTHNNYVCPISHCEFDANNSRSVEKRTLQKAVLRHTQAKHSDPECLHHYLMEKTKITTLESVSLPEKRVSLSTESVSLPAKSVSLSEENGPNEKAPVKKRKIEPKKVESAKRLPTVTNLDFD